MIRSYEDFQRGCARERSIEELPNELLVQIFGDKLETLAKIALVSKRFKKIGWDMSPLWGGFCRVCELGDVSPYPQTFKKHALIDGNRKALELFSGFYRDGTHVSQNLEKAYKYLTYIEAPTEEESIDVCLLEVFLKIDYPCLTKICDSSAFRRLSILSQNPNMTTLQKLKSNYGRAKMRLQLRTNKVVDHQAVRILQKISENLSASPELKIDADLDIADMYVQRRTNLVTLDDVALSLQEISQDQNIPEKQRVRADLMIAELHVQNRLNSLTSQETHQLLESISENRNADWDDRFQAKILIATVRLKGPRDQVEDERAVELLQSIVRDPNASDFWRDKAEDLSAEFKGFILFIS